MRVSLIIVQHPCAYEGQYGPNIELAWDEYSMDENPDGYRDALAECRRRLASGEYSAVGEMVIEIPDAKIDAALRPVEVGEVVVAEAPDARD